MDSVTADVVLDVRSKFVQWNIVNPYSVPMIRFPSSNVHVLMFLCGLVFSSDSLTITE